MIQRRPLVSVIIPNYNYAHYLRECIDSVLEQTYPNIEVIVVDDGSKDHSLGLLKGYGNRIRVIEQTNQGVSAARNRGIAEAKGEFIAFLDADDRWAPDKIELQSVVAENENVGMVYTGLQLISGDSKRIGESLAGASGDVLEAIVTMSVPGMPGTASSGLVPAKCLKEIGGFDHKLSTSADWDLWARIAVNYRTEFIDRPLTFYRLHGNGMHLNVSALEKDNLFTLSKIFADPAAARVHHLKRRSFGKIFSIISGSHLHAGNYGKAAYFALRSLVSWPPAMVSALRRMLGRRINSPST